MAGLLLGSIETRNLACQSVVSNARELYDARKIRPENPARKEYAMKLALGLAVCTLLAGAVVWAQADKTDFAEYQGWM